MSEISFIFPLPSFYLFVYIATFSFSLLLNRSANLFLLLIMDFINTPISLPLLISHEGDAYRLILWVPPVEDSTTYEDGVI